MNIIIDKNLMLSPITKLVGITEKRSLMPILSNLLIEFSGESIKLYSTDLEISAIGYIPFKTEQERKIIVHGRKFQEILKEMESGEIHIEIGENTLTMRQKKSEFVLSLQNPEEFPEIQEISGYEEIYIKGETLLEMVRKVDFAVSVDEARYVLTGMFLKGFDGHMIVVGTDGFRMALYKKDIEGLKGFNGIIIPKRSISEIERIVEGDDDVRITIDEKHIQFNTKEVTLISRIIEGSFPEYENVIPENNPNIGRIDKETVFKGLKKVSSIIEKSEPVKITIGDHVMELEAESDIGRAKEVMEIDYKGEKTTLNFNVKFVMDVVSHIDSPSLTIKAPMTYGAVLFEGEGEKDYRNIIMPIRI